MKKQVSVLVLLLLSAWAALGIQGAKSFDGAAKPALATIPVPKISKPLPFKAGETLTYEASFSKFIFSGTIGTLSMTVLQTPEQKQKNLLELRAEAISKGFFPGLLGLKVRDSFSSAVNADDLGLEISTRQVEDNKTHREYRSIINREKGLLTFTEIDRTRAEAEPKTRDRACPFWVQDVLSSLYFIRTQELKEGSVIPIPLSDMGETYNIEAAVLKREEVKIAAGKFKAVQLDARIFNGRFTKKAGELLIWISDDDLRLPLLAKLKTSGYSATVELTGIKQSLPEN
jgi:hypothetical protein